MANAPQNWDQVFTDQTKIGRDHQRTIPMGQALLDDHLKYVKDEGHSDQWQNIEFVRQMGSGSFGSVWEVRTRQKLKKDGLRKIMFWQKWENLRLACKVMTYKNSQFGNVRNSVNTMLADLQRLQFIEHKNIVKYVDFIGIPDPQTGFPYSRILMLMELCNGDIDSFIRGSHTMNEKQTIGWLKQIVSAICYLHYEQYMVHMDIKPQNILYKKVGFSCCQRLYKLGDFGFAIVYNKNQPMQETMFPGGTMDYLAPEWVQAHGNPFGNAGQWGTPVETPPTDIYSLGASVVNCLVGNNIYQGTNVYMLLQNIQNISTPFKDLILQMINQDPLHRPDAQTLSDQLNYL
ncbi:striated muscle-specific serine/threonine-protein kinase-like [Oppia nitens]|uniref:striated muscle-specific serine/threonine-protein kinase-like n=1 Tax=Oppia nitens TaxID=1686743 RepID=UPI0023D97AB3|nr:striated muscle-specific serine/threonine-protein kinase-like [Oppia nitens]